MSKPTIIFFGSFLEYSVQVLEKLHTSDKVEVIGVITTPPRPAGRKQELTKTHVHEYAVSQDIPVYTPEKLDGDVILDLTSSTKDKSKNKLNQLTNLPINQLSTSPDFFVVAGYGKLLPQSWLAYPKIAPINIHFSLLPQFRGAMPGEWAILMDEDTTGVSLIEMSAKLDAGNIYAQARYTLKPDENRETLYHHLYDLGGELFLETIEEYQAYKLYNDCKNYTSAHLFLPPHPQTKTPNDIYAKLLNKNDSYIPWELIQLAMDGKSIDLDTLTDLMKDLPTKILTQSGLAEAIDRMVRALYGWPGVWTEVQIKTSKSDSPSQKRLKIHTSSVKNGKLVLEQVQLEGKKIVEYCEIVNLLI